MSSSRRPAVSITCDQDHWQDSWSRSTVLLGEVEDEQERSAVRPGITISLTLLVAAAVCVSGVGIWAAMFALNLNGLDEASLTLQQETSANFMAATRQFNTPVSAWLGHSHTSRDVFFTNRPFSGCRQCLKCFARWNCLKQDTLQLLATGCH
jgi:hypothetical protein